MKRALLFSGIVGAATLAGGGAIVSAQVAEDIISIPVDSVLRADENSVTRVASAEVPGEFRGAECIAEVESDNQVSVHDGNDLIVSSGDTSGVVEDFESEAFGVRTVEIPLTLGSTLDVDLRMGPDEVSSGGVFITVDCTQSIPPTTEPPTTAPPATVPPEVGPGTTVPDSGTPTTTVVGALPPSGQPSSPSGSLPATGPSSTTWVALLATALLGGGFGLAQLARRPQ